ncbi:MAG TPA: glycosyltransferase [Lachnospiraceae bacterium]|nr:glycosyltransferase [Lachnospiraceae bacterium]
MITISLCMIVKNEEKTLQRCLDSIKDRMDEIIIIDTGSTDRTMEIASAYTDKIYSYQWINDFSDARNFSFSKATMDYIYMADADEVLDEANGILFDQLKQVLLPEIDIVQMTYCNQLKFGTVYNFDEELRPKLFKRIRTFHFEDPIHETIVLDPIIFDSDIKILHLPECSHATRDLAIFHNVYSGEKRISKRLHSLYAKELFIYGDDQEFFKALPIFEKTLKDSTRSIDEIKEATCVIAKANRLKNDVPNFFKNALKNTACDGCSEICFELGEYYFKLSDYEEAIIWYYNAAYETECILNIHYCGDYPLLALSKCYHALGNADKAREYKELAIAWK